MYNIWFCRIIDEDDNGYLSLSYEKLIYEELKKDEVERHCKGLEKEWLGNYEFDRIDHEQYVRFKNNNEYCLFIEELFDKN